MYHICPNFHPDEVPIGEALIAVAGGVERLVYHSVLHPQTEAMPHHWRKLRVEELLLKHRPGRATFLRPAPYVQNMAPYIADAKSTGELRIPYSVELRSAMVDLDDVGRAAVVALGDRFEHGSGWDLCGAVTNATEIAEILGVVAVEVEPPDDVPPEIKMMFDYMGSYGLPASTGQLRALIGEPTPLEVTLKRLAA